MDATKLRLFAAVAGILALASVIGLTAACFTVAAILVAIAALMLYIFLLPYRKSSEEIDDLEESTANALADLPFDTLKSLVQKYPVSVSAGAMLLGYTLVRDPKTATRHAQRLLLGLL